jgi:chemotaxis protein CheD
MVKRLAPAHPEALVQQDRIAAQKAVPAATGGGSVDLF